MAYTKKKRPFWNQFRNIIQSCYYVNCPEYPRYSHLGTYWGPRDYPSFEQYILKKLGLPPSQDYKLTRKDQSQGWYPGNLIWRKHKELSNVMLGNCTFITYKRRTQSMMAWSEELGVSYWTIYNRIQKGWPPKYAFSKKKFRAGDVCL